MGTGTRAQRPRAQIQIPEVTPLPAPMPGLSMELEALEPEEPSLAPLAKLPGWSRGLDRRQQEAEGDAQSFWQTSSNKGTGTASKAAAKRLTAATG